MFKTLNLGALSFSAPFEEALSLASTNRFDSLDLSFPELIQQVQQTSIQDVKDRFREVGIRPGGWMLPIDFYNTDTIYQKDLAELPRYAALAQALGSSWCATWIIPFSDELDEDINMKFHIHRLRPVAQILADHGSRLGLEFLGPKMLRANHKYPFISTIAGALELGDRLQTGNTGLLLDAWHWYTSHASVDELRCLTANQVVYVHVNDAPADRNIDEQVDEQRLLPGTSGVIDIVGFLQALDHIGFDGPVAVEPFNAELNTLKPTERAYMAGQSIAKIWEQAELYSKKKESEL